jgi:hypothetical protein
MNTTRTPSIVVQRFNKQLKFTISWPCGCLESYERQCVKLADATDVEDTLKNITVITVTAATEEHDMNEANPATAEDSHGGAQAMTARLTKEQAAIIGAYTGVVCGPFADVHTYAEKMLKRSIVPHELTDKMVRNEVRHVAKDDFLSLCYREDDSGGLMPLDDLAMAMITMLYQSGERTFERRVTLP